MPTITAVLADITEPDVDAIVNPARPANSAMGAHCCFDTRQPW